ncbi:MAG: beta-lactamase superfamily II metal-dependent hydrolase [Flavobacteriaceae bacterium]
MGLLIKSLKANHGDCFLFKDLESDITFIVDCGLKITYKHQIFKFTEKADFIILTHIDEDHILGAIPLLEDVPTKFSLKKVYLNSSNQIPLLESHGNISVKQAKTLGNLLIQKKIPVSTLIQGQKLIITKNLFLQIISPTKNDLIFLHQKKFQQASADKDIEISIHSNDHDVSQLISKKDEFLSINSDIVNACSIAFILHYKQKKLLYLSDAHPEVIASYLESLGYSCSNKLAVDIVKLSHHGSSKSISNRLLRLISCSNYWISTNGGKAKAKHPSPTTLAKIAVSCARNGSEAITFYFNHPISGIESRNGNLMNDDDKKKYNVIFSEINEVEWR